MSVPDDIAASLEAAVSQKVSGKDVAVAFSGGLDSGIVASLAKKHADSVMLYTVGSMNSYDSIEADKGAKELGLDIRHLELDDIAKNAAEMVGITGTVDPVTVSFELPLFYVCKSCDRELILTGQGADEMFGGYSKYVGLDENGFEEQRRKDIERLFSVTIEHESKVARHFGKETFYPFMDPNVLDSLSAIDVGELMPGELRKEKLREIAESMGLGYFADKKKKAAQYGSGANDMLKAEAKARGMTLAEFIGGMRG